MAEQYLTNKENWTEEIGAESPRSWTVVEIGLMKVADRPNCEGKMMDIQEVFRLAKRYCETLDRLVSALKYLYSFGVIVCWFDVAGLKDTIFTDPQWLFDVMSIYITELHYGNVPGHLWSDLEQLKENGHMSRALAEGLLTHRELGVKPDNYNKIFHVLQLVDIFCPALSDCSSRKLAVEDAKEFYVPCLLENDFEEETAWEQSGAGNAVCQSNIIECQPPSLIIKPSNVDHFPEPLFFRLSARTAHEFPNNPKLKRNRIEVHLPGDLELELLYHHSTCCVIATVFPTKKQQMPNCDVINKQCVWVRRFLCWQLSDCKRRGINGFKYKVYFQFDKKVGQIDMEEKSLYEIPVGDQMREAISNKHGRLTEADCKPVMLWYCSKAQNDAASRETSLQLPDLRDIAKCVEDMWWKLAGYLEPRPFYRNEWVNFEDATDQSEDGEALRMLQAWKEEHKDQATSGRLKQALTAAGLQDVVDKLWKQPIASSSGKVTRTKFIDVVIRYGHDKTYRFGSKLLLNAAEINALIDRHPDFEGKLQAIIDKAKSTHGIEKTVDKLVTICRDLEILGGVKDELGIKFEDKIVFYDEDDGDVSHASNRQSVAVCNVEETLEGAMDKEECQRDVFPKWVDSTVSELEPVPKQQTETDTLQQMSKKDDRQDTCKASEPSELEALAKLRSKADSRTEARELVLVARKVKWDECASVLDPEESVFTMSKIQAMSEQNTSDLIKARMVLNNWSESFKEAATNHVIIKALCDMELNTIATEIFGAELVAFVQQQ